MTFSVAPGSVCTALPPITWSQADSDRTIYQVKQHNAAWKAVCEPVEK